ncbi:MAG TPA: FAD:protein FMN transferase [Ruminiclostridium sp.]|nr:FAD:protein FMN transferase [Ruminiclostridium sp.]
MKSYLEKSFYALGTLNNIKIFDCSDSELMDYAIGRVMEIDDLMSAYKSGSDISKLNRNAGKGFVQIHQDTYNLLERSIKFSKLSEGAFDITIRPLVELWGIGKKGSFIPPESLTENIKKLVDFRKIRLHGRNKSAFLKEEGQAIDLGGIAKGFAADEVKRILMESNAACAVINLGGNVITIGTRVDGSPWQIGIQHPLKPTGQYMGIVSVVDKTIVTSGSNEKFFIKDNVRYHHILDPRTGRPVQSGILSVTVISDSSTDADALTTSIFVLGTKRGFELARRLGAEIIVVTERLEILASNGLENNLKILN